MRNRFSRRLTAVVWILVLAAGCGDGGGVSEGMPADAKGGAAPVMPGGELKSLKDISKETKTAPVMPGAPATP